jgi:hypothetical protein
MGCHPSPPDSFHSKDILQYLSELSQCHAVRNITKGGKPDETPNPYPEIRKHAEKNHKWYYLGEVAWLNRKFDQFEERFFDGIVAPDRPSLPVAPRSPARVAAQGSPNRQSGHPRG